MARSGGICFSLGFACFDSSCRVVALECTGQNLTRGGIYTPQRIRTFEFLELMVMIGRWLEGQSHQLYRLIARQNLGGKVQAPKMGRQDGCVGPTGITVLLEFSKFHFWWKILLFWGYFLIFPLVSWYFNFLQWLDFGNSTNKNSGFNSHVKFLIGQMVFCLRTLLEMARQFI